ncbi:MAG: hypothetical protein K2P66_02590 [Lachnospiraceae bacterium]|nr:hypothetical protein [Lachnospiraceae bacterium]
MVCAAVRFSYSKVCVSGDQGLLRVCSGSLNYGTCLARLRRGMPDFVLRRLYCQCYNLNIYVEKPILFTADLLRGVGSDG